MSAKIKGKLEKVVLVGDIDSLEKLVERVKWEKMPAYSPYTFSNQNTPYNQVMTLLETALSNKSEQNIKRTNNAFR